MMRRTLLLVAILTSACHSSTPTTRPTIEDVRPGGPVCFPRSQPDARGLPDGSDSATTQPAEQTPPAQPSPATQPTSAVLSPTTQAAAHGTPGHWCALCAAAAARQAEQGRERVTLIAPDADLMSDLPKR